MNKNTKKVVSFFLTLCICMCIFGGCGVGENSGKPLTISGFAFNTTYTISLYSGGDQDVLEKCVSMCTEFENIFSRTKTGSEVYNVNEIMSLYQEAVEKNNVNSREMTAQDIKDVERDIKNNMPDTNTCEFFLDSAGKISIEISDMMYSIMERGLYYSKESGGNFDITIEPISCLWDFTSEKKVVPKSSYIKNALKYIGYENLELSGDNGQKSVSFAVPGMGVDLGGIAKGFIADEIKDYLTENGVKSGMINLGGNVLCIGSKPDNDYFSIGIQKPFADTNETITAVKADDISVVSSGVYERYFEQDGELYHHILNPKTGYSYDNGLVGVTIISKKSVDGDGLSTTCFSLGLEKGMSFINTVDNAVALFITDDGKLHYSDGFKDYLME